MTNSGSRDSCRPFAYITIAVTAHLFYLSVPCDEQRFIYIES